MSKFSFKRRLLLCVGVGTTLAVFFAARVVASWRPQLIGVQPMRWEATFGGPLVGGQFLTLSPDEKWLLFSGGVQWDKRLIWDLRARTSRPCDLHTIKFSPDSQMIAGLRKTPKGQSVVLQTPSGEELWSSQAQKFNIDRVETFDIEKKVIRVVGAYTIYFFDRKTKVPLRKTPRSSSEWRVSSVEGISPDGLLFWSSSNSTNKGLMVKVSHVKTKQVLWSFLLEETGKNSQCFPAWEEGGKLLTTIERDTLFVRDSRTGKIVLSHKSNLPSPLKSWGFTKDRKTVYLLDIQGRIFRQRLR